MSQAMKSAESRLGVVRKVCDANIIWSDENMCACVCCCQNLFGLNIIRSDKNMCVCVCCCQKKVLDSNIIRSDEKMCVCECPVNENRAKANSLLCKRCFAAKDVCAVHCAGAISCVLPCV